ncbi:MAG: N-acetyl-gamma-glutamyl-phosphate reductase [Polyangiaceae bacterium]
MLKVGIIGAGGYTGAELVRLVHSHPELEIELLAAREKAGKRLGEVLPSVMGVAALQYRLLESFDPEQATELKKRIEVAFLALPHGASARAGKALYDAGIQVVDLSADFRLKDADVYRQAYAEHPAPELLAKAVYGQPELHRDELRDAKLIAAPGCHVTTALLPLAPLLKNKLIDPNSIVIDSKTGVSGGGRSPGPAYHFPETSEGVRAYAVGGKHRHIPEIEQELSRVAGSAVRVSFTPSLIPMTRGILCSAYARALPGASEDACRAAAQELYADSPLVSVLPANVWPDTLWVRGSARAMVNYAFDARTNTVTAFGVTDNLTRGASAQAIQALNLSRGWKETLGLPELALFP